jgi:hypothetical protein
MEHVNLKDMVAELWCYTGKFDEPYLRQLLKTAKKRLNKDILIETFYNGEFIIERMYWKYCCN